MNRFKQINAFYKERCAVVDWGFYRLSNIIIVGKYESFDYVSEDKQIAFYFFIKEDLIRQMRRNR